MMESGAGAGVFLLSTCEYMSAGLGLRIFSARLA